MCGAAAWALSASMVSHFSMTRKLSGPHLVWNGRALSASTAAPYSMQPFSARTAGTLARNACRIASRLPGLAVMTAMTWIMAAGIVAYKASHLRARRFRASVPPKHGRTKQADHGAVRRRQRQHPALRDRRRRRGARRHRALHRAAL